MQTMQLAVMEFFQQMASPFLDTLFELATMLGEEMVFIFAIAFLLWCSSKRRGFAIFSSLFTSLVGMNLLKAAVKAPRPFQTFPHIAGKRVATATGYSFPSGHTTGAASFYSSVAVSYRKRWLSITCAILIFIVGLSRMYLGVHWPIDVFAGLALGITVTFVTHGWFLRLYDRTETLVVFSLIVGIVSMAGAMLLTILLETGMADPVGFTDLMKLLSLAGGGYLGFAWEQRRIGYTTEGTAGMRILRFAVGIAVLMIIQGSKAVLPSHLAFSFLRYAATGIWTTGLYPFIGIRISIGSKGHLFERKNV